MLEGREIEAVFEAAVADDPELAERLAALEMQKAPFEYQRCDNCVYYLGYQQWCDHPDLQLVVGADWWCNAWRI